MKNKILFLILFFFVSAILFSQQQPDKRKLRIVDTLTTQEKNNRNPVILKAELDSMIQLYMAGLPPVRPQDPVKEIVTEIPVWVTIAGIFALAVVALLLYVLFRYHKRLNKTVSDLKRLIQNFEFYSASVSSPDAAEKGAKKKTSLEKKLNELSGELEKQKADYETVMHEYGLIKQSIAEVYKVRNYPLFDKTKSEEQIIQDLLKTEKIVAHHAFEKFLKPVLAIADANKNNPAKISPEDSEKMLELLVSLSLYYIEYLYLRVSDLSVGGNIVQRIGSNGKGIDPALLKKLNTEHGSRALALRMALNKSGIDKLSYPVFDETDLNNF
jgi:Sec-independent protein translocase protein TatA